MHYLLKENNYAPPYYLKEIKENKILDAELLCTPEGNRYTINTSGNVWMSYNFDTDEEALELYSHYDLAEGHCICTGLGLGVREMWLLKNPKVASITVIEKNKSIIQFHEKNNSFLTKRVKIIESPADCVVAECDTLLLDHFNNESWDYVNQQLVTTCKNIKAKKMWFWAAEEYLLEVSKPGRCHQEYLNLRRIFPMLPELSEQKLYEYLAAWMPTYATRDRMSKQP